MKKRVWLCRVAFVALLLSALPASAGGLFLPARGARPLGRAGSFVAGADDAGALYYNPAGLADIPGISTLVDLSLIFQQVTYARVDSGNNQLAPVSGSMDILPIPTLALTLQPKTVPWLTLAGGVWAPNIGINSWPENGPQRYSAISLKGSLLAVTEFAAAFRINRHFWLGVGVENMLLKFHSRVMLSACIEVNCAPESPNFDSLTELDALSLFTPSGIVGATVAYDQFRAGLALQLPFWVRATGSVRSRLPSDPEFTNSEIHGDSIDMSFNLPLVLRAGFEYRPQKETRLEIGFDYEAWSMQEQYTIKPNNIVITNVPGIGNYTLSTLSINRHLRDSYSVHIGAEHSLFRDLLILRAGYLFESSATPDATASVLHPDGLHNLISFGFGTKIKNIRLDLAYAHVFTLDRTVHNSEAHQLTPIRPSAMIPVGNGSYSVAADILSLGMEARF